MSLNVSSSEFLEFSNTCRLPCDALSPFFDLHDFENLCHVSNHFKTQFLEKGRQEAFKMHEVGLCKLLFIDRISNSHEAWCMPIRATINTTVSYYHNSAVKDSHCTLFTFKGIAQTRIFPIPLYKRLIKHTASEVFSNFCHRFHLSRFLQCENRITLLFSVYSQLRKAHVCLPEQWALATRASVEPPKFGGISDLIKRIGTEFIAGNKQNSLDSRKVNEQLECVIKIIEQNPCAKLRGNIQIDLATLCIKRGKVAIARKLLADVQDCESYYNHSYSLAVSALFKDSVANASLFKEVEAYLKRDFLTRAEQIFYLKQITYILKPLQKG